MLRSSIIFENNENAKVTHTFCLNKTVEGINRERKQRTTNNKKTFSSLCVLVSINRQFWNDKNHFHDNYIERGEERNTQCPTENGKRWIYTHLYINEKLNHRRCLLQLFFLPLLFISFHFEIVCRSVLMFILVLLCQYFYIILFVYRTLDSVSAFHSHSHAVFFCSCVVLWIDAAIASVRLLVFFFFRSFSLCVFICVIPCRFAEKIRFFMHIRSQCRLFVLKSWRRERIHSNTAVDWKVPRKISV